MSATFLNQTGLTPTGGAVGGRRYSFSPLRFFNTVELMFQVRRERSQLGRLSREQLADLGIDPNVAAREAKRGLFDLPRERVSRIG